jgi:hypothetical protein
MKIIPFSIRLCVFLSMFSFLFGQSYGQVTPGDSIHAIKYVIDLQEMKWPGVKEALQRLQLSFSWLC